MAEILTPIDPRLRLILFGLSCALGIDMSRRLVDQVFDDAASDQVSPTGYTFVDTPRLKLEGRVDAYEPESIWLILQGPRKARQLLDRIAALAEDYWRQLDAGADSRPPQRGDGM